jgi:hypothetical protein
LDPDTAAVYAGIPCGVVLARKHQALFTNKLQRVSLTPAMDKLSPYECLTGRARDKVSRCAFIPLKFEIT